MIIKNNQNNNFSENNNGGFQVKKEFKNVWIPTIYIVNENLNSILIKNILPDNLMFWCSKTLVRKSEFLENGLISIGLIVGGTVSLFSDEKDENGKTIVKQITTDNFLEKYNECLEKWEIIFKNPEAWKNNLTEGQRDKTNVDLVVAKDFTIKESIAWKNILDKQGYKKEKNVLNTQTIKI